MASQPLTGPPRLVAEGLQQTESALDLEVTIAEDRRVQLSVAIVGHGIARLTVRAAPAGVTAPRVPLAELQAPQSARVTTPGEGSIELTGDGIGVAICFDPFEIAFLDGGGRRLLVQAPIERNVGGEVSLQPFEVIGVDGRLGCRCSFSARPDEHFYGFGEDFGNLDKRGMRLVLWHEDPLGVHSEGTYKNIPFFVSSEGYAIFVDTTTRSAFDLALAHHGAWSVTIDEPVLDLYVIAGAEPCDLIERFCSLVGYPRVPPRWAFGYWLSSGFLRDSHEQAVERARLFREHKLPADVFHLDCYWQRDKHLGDLVWNTEDFPHPAATLDAIREQNYRISFWLTPYPPVDTELFAEAAALGFLLTREDGRPYEIDLWSGTQPDVGIVDFAQPAAAAWYAERLRPLLRLGADVLETDMGESVPVDAYSATGLTGRELHNLYPLLYNDAIASAFEREGMPPMLWGRSTYAGGQRHFVKWGGDPVCSFDAMASTLRGGLSLGVCGHPYWSHDMGGLYGRPSKTLYIRWLQFGFLSGFSRAHGTTTRLPWDYGDDVLEIFRRYAELRYSLVPYIFTAAVDAERTGMPLMRAMPIAFPRDRGAAAADLQYLLGNDLLVAPVFDESEERELYVPPGRWVDYWTGEVLEGPQWARVEAPLERIPFFARGNALVPTVRPAETIGESPFKDVVFLGFDLQVGSTSAVLHDLDGTTRLTTHFDGRNVVGVLNGTKAHVQLRRMFPPDPASPSVHNIARGVSGTSLA